jgi:hypothetical protein
MKIIIEGYTRWDKVNGQFDKGEYLDIEVTPVFRGVHMLCLKIPGLGKELLVRHSEIKKIVTLLE